MSKEHPGNKYHRVLIGLRGERTVTDVYRVLSAFEVVDPGIQHAVKKLLCTGIRGKGDYEQDLTEAIASLKESLLFYQMQKDETLTATVSGFEDLSVAKEASAHIREELGKAIKAGQPSPTGTNHGELQYKNGLEK